MSTAGYSGKPLSAKLGLKAGQRLLVIDGPRHVDALIADAPPGVKRLQRLAEFDVGWVFVTRTADLAPQLGRLLPKLADGGMIWVSWPKKAAGVATDMSPPGRSKGESASKRAARREERLTEDRVRDAALPLGLVDIKVCAVDETWSGLKLTRRRAAPASPRSPATPTRGGRASR